MAQPQWETDAGSLGTIPEGVFYQIQLVAVDPDHPNDPTAVKYKVIAGALPKGIQCTSTGLVGGVPYFSTSISNFTSKFVIRAYTERVVMGVVVVDHVSDRTFEITVAVQDNLNFITPAGNVGSYYDGGPISPIQIQVTEPTASVITLASGALPPGLSLSPTGLITGYIIPLVPVNNIPGFDVDGQTFDQNPFDFGVNSLSTNYQFTLEVSNGRSSVLRIFEIYVYSRSSMTADTTEFTADNTVITADQTPYYTPFLVNAEPSDLGSVRGDNFWAYQFIGLDFGGDVIEYLEYSGAGLGLPPGTTLDLNTGWLYGYLPNLGAVEDTYNFAIYLRKAYYPEYKSDPYYFSLTLTGTVDTDVVWITQSNLGTIVNGSTSTLYVEAVNARPLQYRLLPGTYPTPNVGAYNKLPQGLELLPSGEIAGRVSFNTFALDLGATTFDNNTTTFDMTYTFTVNAYSSDGTVNVYKTFTVTVVREYNEPYENLYIKCMPPQNDRDLINQLILNQDIIPVNLVYRPDDPNFGVAKNVIYQHAYGLTAATYEAYVSSLTINHYWKNLVLGSIKTAQATDAAGNVIYEVVYSEIIDNLVNDQGQSVSKSVELPYPINQFDSTEISTVYPNSLINMRDQVIDTVGEVANVLPRWMISKQANGQVLGFTPAWVICYAKPGAAGKIAYNIAQQYGEQLNKIDFEVDRYELDKLLTHNWDPIADSANAHWVTNNPEEPQLPAETSVDLVPHYRLMGQDSTYQTIVEIPASEPVISGGIGYAVNDQIRVSGSQLGGENGVNDAVITVLEVDNVGTITIATVTGNARLFFEGQTYDAVTGTNISGTGSGAVFDFIIASGETTTFDASSMRFEAPVDMYSSTDSYDKYLVFPRRNILV